MKTTLVWLITFIIISVLAFLYLNSSSAPSLETTPPTLDEQSEDTTETPDQIGGEDGMEDMPSEQNDASNTGAGEDDVAEDEHSAIIGMTEAEANAYAEAEGVPFRIGFRDGEPLALTMDYRPGRITARIEGGIVTDYSVE